MGRPRQVWKDVRALFGPTVVFVLGGPGAGKGGAKPLNPVSEVMVSQELDDLDGKSVDPKLDDLGVPPLSIILISSDFRGGRVANILRKV